MPNLMGNAINNIVKIKIEIDVFGHKSYKLNGDLHRLDGPAIEHSNGIKEWYLNGKLHRTDGPAIECRSGYKAWYLNDRLHRIDGPAIVYPNGAKKWYLNGIEQLRPLINCNWLKEGF